MIEIKLGDTFTRVDIQAGMSINVRETAARLSEAFVTSMLSHPDNNNPDASVLAKIIDGYSVGIARAMNNGNAKCSGDCANCKAPHAASAAKDGGL